MSSIRDGLGNEEVQGSGLAVGNSGYFAGSVYSESNMEAEGSLEAGTTVTAGTTVANAVGLCSNVGGIGSPTTWGLIAQTGSYIISGASYVVKFPTAFGALPTLHVSLLQSGAAASFGLGIPTANGFSGAGISGLQYHYLAVGIAA